MSPRNDNIDVIRSRFHRAANFFNSLAHGRQAGRKSRGNRGHANPTASQRSDRGFNETMVYANRRHFEVEIFDLKTLQKFTLNRLPRFGAQASHAVVGVISGKRGQVHAGDCPQEPSRLPFFFHRSPRPEGLRPALHCAGVHAHLFDPIKI
jgi:hypothetical protein